MPITPDSYLHYATPSSDQIEEAVRRIEHNIRSTHDDVKRIFVEAASILPSTANKIAADHKSVLEESPADYQYSAE